MYQNEYVISTDLKRKMTSVVPQFVQYDKAVLIFKIYDNGIPFPIEEVTEIEVTNLRPDGKAIVGLGVPVQLDDDSWAIKYSYLGSEMTVIGINKVGLSMFKGEDKVSILPFDVHIVQDPREIAGDESTEDAGLLTQLIKSVKQTLEDTTEVLEDANQAIYDVQEAIEDVTELGENLTEEIENSQTQTALAKDVTDEAITATQDANAAASNATTQASYAQEQGDYAKEQGEFAQTQGTEAQNKALFAQEQGDYAQEQGDYAKEQGDFAKEKGDYAVEKTAEIEQAHTDLSQIKADVVDATQEANNQATYAQEQGDYAKEQGDEVADKLNDIENAKDTLISEASDAIETVNEKGDIAEQQGIFAQEQGDYAQSVIDNYKHVGDWQESVEYKKNQEVLFNGSTYRAIEDNEGTQPITNTNKWQLIAQRGLDGEGAVSSVNSLLPDENGNVNLGKLLTLTTNNIAEIEIKSPMNLLEEDNLKNIIISDVFPTGNYAEGTILIKRSDING